MDYQQAKVYCGQKPEAQLDYPFGPEPATFKIRGKIYAILGSLDGRDYISLKCDPDRATALRDIYSDVIAGYHLNKKHWNSVFFNGDVPDSEIESLIDHSFALVTKSLKKADRQSLEIKFTAEQLYGK